MIERATVTRVVGRQVFVEVPKLGLGVEYGPCDVAWQSARTLMSDLAGDLASSDTSHTHTYSGTDTGGYSQSGTTSDASVASSHDHALPKLEVGMRVIVSPVHGVKDDLVVLGIIG